MSSQEWEEITKDEFLELRKRAVKFHTLSICIPPINFYWDAVGAQNEDLSFGQHAFLKEIVAENLPPYVWDAQYWKSTRPAGP